MKFMRLLMFGTVMLMANGAGAQNSVKPFHLDEATISDVHAAYKSGALTSVRLVQAYLERIRACDQAGPKLNVVISLNPRALEEAAALDKHFRRTGKFVGPLCKAWPNTIGTPPDATGRRFLVRPEKARLST
jgi:hypothetical protein